MITSLQNEKIKWLRALQTQRRTRKKSHAFIVEGFRLLEEAIKADIFPQLFSHTEKLPPRGNQIIQTFKNKGIPSLLVSDKVMTSISDTKTPQGVLAVFEMPKQEIPKPLTFVLILDNLRDPGNLGTILRTATAANVDAIFLTPGNVDPYAPKVVRSGMGAHFHLPILQLTWEEIKSHTAGMNIFLSTPTLSKKYTDANFRESLGLIIGGEAFGAGDEARNISTERIYIPMPGGSESLNTAVAASILCYEVLRQRGVV
jgi:TrmH family RNA methyltransferase